MNISKYVNPTLAVWTLILTLFCVLSCILLFKQDYKIETLEKKCIEYESKLELYKNIVPNVIVDTIYVVKKLKYED